MGHLNNNDAHILKCPKRGCLYYYYVRAVGADQWEWLLCLPNIVIIQASLGKSGTPATSRFIKYEKKQKKGAKKIGQAWDFQKVVKY